MDVVSVCVSVVRLVSYGCCECLCECGEVGELWMLWVW